MKATRHVEIRIGEALTRLAVARGSMMDDITAEVYLERLGRFDPVLVRRACEWWSDVPRKEFETALPDVGNLIETIETLKRHDAAKEAASRILPMPKQEEDEPTYFCPNCRDEPFGFAILWCPGSGQLYLSQRPEWEHDHPMTQCGRRDTHGPHTFSDRCACRDVNPKIAEHRRRIYGAVDRRHATGE